MTKFEFQVINVWLTDYNNLLPSSFIIVLYGISLIVIDYCFSLEMFLTLAINLKYLKIKVILYSIMAF